MKKIIILIISLIFISSIAGAYATMNNNTNEKLNINEDGSSIVTIHLIDNYGNTLINYEKKLNKGQSWTIQENNVANRIGHIESEDGGKVNPSNMGARYVKNGRTYSIIGYNTEFPIKVTANGENYTRDIILNVEPVDCYITLTYVDNITGETIRTTTNNILKGDSWIVEQVQFDNVVSNRMNITVDDRNYTFIGFNTSTPLIMEWQPEDYEVVVCLDYDEVILPPEVDNETNNTIDNETQTDDYNETNDEIIEVNDDNQTADNENVTNQTNKPIINGTDTIDDKNNDTISVPLLETGNPIGLIIMTLFLIVGLIIVRRM